MSASTRIHKTGAILAFALCTQVFAQSDHQPLRTSNALGFTEVFQAALQVAPEAVLTAEHQQTADDFQALGRRWINNRPSWESSFIDDGLLDATGLREIEAGVRFDLWRPGERSQARVLGSSYTGRADAWQQYFTLLVAGRVRAVLADITRAEKQLELEREATAEAERLLAITTNLFEAGQIPELDVLQVRTLLLDQRKTEMQAEAELVDAERTYVAATGLEVRPAGAHQESLTAEPETLTTHPYLQFLQAEVDLAQANVDKARLNARGSPSMTVGVRRERGISQQPYTDSVGLSFSIPFGGSAAVAATTSTARNARVTAEIEYARSLQRIRAEQHELEHSLFLIEQSLALSLEQAEISQRHWEMSRAAFEAGEITLNQVVIALQNSQQSAKAHALLLLEQQQRITEYNQAVGVLP